MRFRLWVVVTVAFLLIVSQPLAAQKRLQSWESIRLGVTAEGEILYKFGLPDYVVIAMHYDEFQVFRTTRTAAFDWWYTFKYLPIRGSVPILDGPLGRADAAEVSFSSSTGKVVQVEWTYDERLSAQAIQDALGIEMKLVGVIQIGSKKHDGGEMTVLVSAPKFNSTSVTLALPTTKD